MHKMICVTCQNTQETWMEEHSPMILMSVRGRLAYCAHARFLSDSFMLKKKQDHVHDTDE